MSDRTEREPEPPIPNRWPLQRILLGIAIGAVGIASVTAVIAQQADGWDVTRSGPTSGGGESSGGSYALHGVVGQAVVGRASGGSYAVESGLLGGSAEKSYRYVPFVASDGVY